MTQAPINNLSRADLTEIRDAVPALDLLAIRSLRRAGFEIVRQDLGEHTDAGEGKAQEPAADWATSRRSSNSAA